jgi:hypothetical protein
MRRSLARIAVPMALVTGMAALAAPAVLHRVHAPSSAARWSEPARLAPRPPAPGQTDATRSGTHIRTYNWAGWADTAGTFTHAAASWVEPTVSCPTPDAVSALWVGLDGASDTTVEQAGTIAECDGTAATHWDWWEMYPTNAIQVETQVEPGDHITASVTYGAGHFLLSVDDATRPGSSFSLTESCGAGLTCARSSAEWIVEAPSEGSALFPLADFGTSALNTAAVAAGGGDEPIATTDLDPERITMVSLSGRRPLATTSRLRARGTAFSVQWHRAS